MHCFERACLQTCGFSRKAPKDHRRMRIYERLFLNPFTKWERYGIFPFALLLHTTLLFLVTAQIVFYLKKDITHASTTAQHFSHLFLGTTQGAKTLMQPRDLQDAIERSVRNIFLVNNVTFNDVAIFVDGVRNSDQLPIVLTFRNGTHLRTSLSRNNFLDEANTESYLRNEVPMLYMFGDYGVEQLKALSMSFSVLETVHSLPDPLYFLWNITINYDGSQVGMFKATLSYLVGTSGHGNEYGSHGSFHKPLNLAVLIFATLSFFLMLKKVLRSFSVLRVLRGTVLDDEEVRKLASEVLTFEDQASLFNWWWAVTLLGNCVQIVASSRCLTTTPDVTGRFSLLGWSGFLTWVNICQYFESFPRYYVTFRTASKGIASVCRYMFSVMPILTAFVFLGTCNFWQAPNFNGLSGCYATLFSLINGDLVHDTFDDLGDVSGWFGHFYLYVFIFYFIYIVYNINISIIEEAFFSARFEGVRHDEQMESAQLLQRMTSGDSDYSPVFSRVASYTLSGEGEGAGQQCSGMDIDTRKLDTKISWNTQNTLTTPLVCPSEPSAPPAITRAAQSSPAMPSSSFSRTSISAGPSGSPHMFPLKGRMSPRLLENPRLQGVLAAAYPTDFPKRGRNFLSAWRGQESILSSPEHALKAPDSLPDPSPCQRKHNTLEPPGRNPTPDPGEATTEWWLQTINQWTHMLRTIPLPRRSEARDDPTWRELERALAVHSNALSESTFALYRELQRT